MKKACIWFTGLSGAGKTTLAEALSKVLEAEHIKFDLLDGDEIREHLSKGLSFSKEDRDINVKRVGYVASKIVKHGGVVLCSLISPYFKTREEVRKMVEKEGKFIEVYVATSLKSCEQRDVKGLYKQARDGKIKNFTGVSDPYEAPLTPEISIYTENKTIKESVKELWKKLNENSF